MSVVARVALSGQTRVCLVWSGDDSRTPTGERGCSSGNPGGSQRAAVSEVCVINDEVVDIAVSVGASSGEEIIVDIPDVIDVGTKLESMVAACVRDRICELKTSLIRESSAIQKISLTEGETIRQCHLRRESVSRCRLSR